MSTCVFLSVDPVAGTVGATDKETGQALTVTAHDHNPRLIYVNAQKDREVVVTYEAQGVAHALYTPPPLINPTPLSPPAPDPDDPFSLFSSPQSADPVTTTTIEDVGETLFVFHAPCPSYPLNSELKRTAAFVTLTHDPYIGFPSYNYQISCMYEHPRAGAITTLVKSDMFGSRDEKTVRLLTLSRTMTGHFHEALVPAGHTVFVTYKREVTTTTQPGEPLPSYTKQPGCSAKITAHLQDGSMAGVTATHTLSVRDCTGETGGDV